MLTKITKAVAIIRNSSELEDDELYQVLVKAGFERRFAARLVEFLPAAYCRVLLAEKGAQFPDTFRRRRADGTISDPISLASEPVWEAALTFANQEIEQGATFEQKLQIAGRSAHFHAANSLLKQGSKLENIAFVPAILSWPEDGPTDGLMSSQSVKPWWRFW